MTSTASTLTKPVILGPEPRQFPPTLFGVDAADLRIPPHNLGSAQSSRHCSKVEQLPFRTAWDVCSLKEKIVLPRTLEPPLGSVLLQVKHTLLDFSSLRKNYDVVPGGGIIGKVVTLGLQEAASALYAEQYQYAAKHPAKCYVFPYSACWVQRAAPCANCRKVARSNIHSYDVHRRWPCLARWKYGETIDGGLQTYVHVASPEHILVEIPRAVSLHDVCFLEQVAVPFYAYCIDVLARAIEKSPGSRILVILNDAEREANDCLLVRHHLGYEHMRMTFTDLKSLAANPELRQTYTRRFEHVLVFASGTDALLIAVELGVPVGRESEECTLALFDDSVRAPTLVDRQVNCVRPSYKDKFLLESLLATLAMFNRGDRTPLIGSRDSTSSEQNLHAQAPHTLPGDGTHDGRKLKPEEALSRQNRGHVSWLHCDMDLYLCTDEACNQGPYCQLTASVNDMVHSNTKLRRVFYTHRLLCPSQINAFVF